MKFKKLRYNIIVIGLIAIVACCVAFPLITGGDSSTNQGAIDNNLPNIEIPDEPIQEPEDPEEPEEPTNNEDEDKPDFESFKPIDLLNYSIDLLYNGKGFSSEYTQVCTNVAKALGGEIKVVQNAKGTIVRNGNTSLQEGYLWSTYSGIGSEQTQNYYQYYYIDKDNNKFDEGKATTYDYKKMTYDSNSLTTISMTYDEGMTKWLVMYGDSFPINTTKKDTILYNDVGNYREIKVRYDINGVSSNVKKFFGTTGQMSDISYNGLEIVYKINLKTGKMYSITRTETLSGKVMSFNATTTAITTQVFRSVDIEQEIIHP